MLSLVAVLGGFNIMAVAGWCILRDMLVKVLEASNRDVMIGILHVLCIGWIA